MPRPKSPTLTEAELRLMDVVWDRGAATVGEVAESLPTSPPLAYSTVLTTMRILEDKGYLRHTKNGRAFVYEPIVDRKQASRNAISLLLSRFFRNSPELLMLNLLEHEKLSSAERRRLQKLIDESERGGSHELG